MPAPKKTATKLTVEKKATVISKATHEKVVAEKDATIKEKKSEITTAKKDALDWEQRAKDAEKKLAEIGDKIHGEELKAGNFVQRHWWASGAIILLLSGVIIWAMAVHISKDTERENKAVNAYKAFVQDSLKRVDYKNTGQAVDSSAKVVSGIPRVNPAGVKKN